MKREIVIDTYECNGCGGCVEICPEVFQMDETGDKAIVLDHNAPITAAVEEAVVYCASKCITIE